MSFGVCLRETHAKQTIMRTNFDSLLQIADRLIEIASEYLRRLHVNLAQCHIGAASFKRWVSFDHRVHLVFDVVDVRQSGERIDLGIAAIVRSQPEVSLWLIVV